MATHTLEKTDASSIKRSPSTGSSFDSGDDTKAGSPDSSSIKETAEVAPLASQSSADVKSPVTNFFARLLGLRRREQLDDLDAVRGICSSRRAFELITLIPGRYATFRVRDRSSGALSAPRRLGEHCCVRHFFPLELARRGCCCTRSGSQDHGASLSHYAGPRNILNFSLAAVLGPYYGSSSFPIVHF